MAVATESLKVLRQFSTLPFKCRMKRLSRDTIFQSENLSSDLGRKSVSGGMAVMSAQGIQFALRMAGTVVLARMLTPEDYGLIAMVTVVVGFAQMFKDAGLSMATVQKDRISHEQISTLFWINILISVFIAACVLVASPLVARFYGRPELAAVTAALSVSFIISGLMIQHQALLRRHMQFGTLAIIQITSQIITLGVTIVLAFFGWRYWALVGGTITTALAGTLMTLFFCPWVPGRMKKGTGVRDMLKFGGHLTGFNFINYFSRNLDSILIGKFIGGDALGLYAKAYKLFMMPISQVRGPMTKVAMPVFSALKEKPERYIKYYQRLLDTMASLTIPLTLYCVIEADFLIHLLLGPQWLGAVPVFRLLAIAGVIQPIAGTRGLVLLSCGFSDRYLYWGLANAVLMITAFVAGLPFGIKGVAAAYAVANYAVLIPSLFYCFHMTPVTVSLFMKTLVLPFFISVLAASVVILVKRINTNDSITSHLVLLGVFGIIYVGASCCRKSVRETMAMFLKGLPGFSKIKGGA